MNKLGLYLISAVVLGVVGYQIYTTEVVRRDFKSDLNEFDSDYEALVKDNEKLNEEIRYFSEDHNLEKEARTKYNYKAPGEKMIIVAPRRE